MNCDARFIFHEGKLKLLIKNGVDAIFIDVEEIFFNKAEFRKNYYDGTKKTIKSKIKTQICKFLNIKTP